MAANNETSNPERNRGWYREDLTELNEPMRNLLEKYSKIPSENVVSHVNQLVRADAYFPLCLQSYAYPYE